MDRQKAQPVALLLPLRDNRAKTRSGREENQRCSGSSILSYTSGYSGKSDSGISNSLRHSDASETSHRPEESEWSGWDAEEPTGENGEGDDDDDEYDDTEEYDAGYEDEDEYEDTENGDFYEDNPDGYYNTGEEEEYEATEEELQDNPAEYQQEQTDSRLLPFGYKGPRYRKYKVAKSQNAEDYQPRLEMGSQEKCQEWLRGRRKDQPDESTWYSWKTTTRLVFCFVPPFTLQITSLERESWLES